ncbi:aminopeptidase N [Corynebacterium sp. SCR221107]|uniref:aminopeptidase N n=1 Tax=Corynebacterium sp. SCR221107 TaxID=3017361 RepID=UPI0022EC74AA|nr:aminopeptidase N [Corynebacterium sp. SCR221107]WBT08218.1 aminopeptidase N [Corynebacterium sp. SCR221107]
MSSINLTRIEAQARKAMLADVHYAIALDLTASEVTFPSTTTVTFTATAEGDTFIDLRAESVAKVTLDGVDITPESYRPDHGIELAHLGVGKHELVVEATCRFSRTGQGLHRFVDPADGEVYLYTQFETADAKRVFACFDQPDLKATYDLAITAPATWKVITNSPQEVEVTGDTAVFHSAITVPLSTYLIAICAGHYHEVTDTWRGTLTHHPQTPAGQPHELEIPLAIYCRASLADHLDAQRLFRETKQGFDFYHANFGVAYPFGKYDQLFVPEFNAGAMENAGAITFRDEYVFTAKETRYRYERRCETILHEMAHMWFGDLVTMAWWDDLWLNESFATWGAAISQAEATEYDTSWVTFANVEKSWAYQQDQLPSTHPISTDASDIETVEQNFDGITYAKGASVLKQLQAYVGREAFFAGVRTHFATHAFSNATFADLLGALEAASGRDLSGWADQWLKTTGINTLEASFEIIDGAYTAFALTQTGAQPGAGELRTHRVAVGLYSLIDGQVVRTNRVELDLEGARVAVPELVGQAAADLVLVNDDDLTYCLISLDPDSLAFVVDNIDKIVDPMARTLCWSAAWEMTRDGKMRARDFLALVARGAGSETEIAVLERILMQATRAVESYADPAWAQHTGYELLATTLLEGARDAEPGSDFQLAFVQALAKVRLNAQAVEFFTAIVGGHRPIDGLVIDAGLRWWALTALIAADAIAEPDSHIEALLAEDNTASGHVAATRARAAVPTRAVKQAVFDEVTAVPNTLSNLELRHKLEGLTFTGSAPLLEGFGAKVFEVAPVIWKELSQDMGLNILTGVYPRWEISDQAIAAAEDFLKDDSLAPGLRRVIAEGKAGQERALRNQRFDAVE